MHCDILVAEIGSTTTLVNAFDGLNSRPRFIGQGQAVTTVLDGDVCIGLRAAIEDLTGRLYAKTLKYDRLLATSSAAGGLKMCVHGLVFDMTVRAAEAAALGAGAVIRQTTAGKLHDEDVAELRVIEPNLILLAGGTDFGERETSLYNARILATKGTGAPVLYAGNRQNCAAMERIFSDAGTPLYITENVYPKLDELNIEPARRLIHEAFERHITDAPGMTQIREMVNGAILPTPGAIMEAAMMLYSDLGDLIVFDIGGATTDVHSVTNGSEKIAQLLIAPEPFNKRTVEGDLGLYINATHLVDKIGVTALSKELAIDVPEVLSNYQPIPQNTKQLLLTQRLCVECGRVALTRHVGRLRHLFMPDGRKTYAEGKDCSMVRSIIGTGGALTRLSERESILRKITDMKKDSQMLWPECGQCTLYFDNDYIMASLGVLSREYPDDARMLMKRSLGCDIPVLSQT